MHEKVLAGFQFAIDQDCQGNWFGNEDGVRKSFKKSGAFSVDWAWQLPGCCHAHLFS